MPSQSRVYARGGRANFWVAVQVTGKRTGAIWKLFKIFFVAALRFSFLLFMLSIECNFKWGSLSQSITRTFFFWTGALPNKIAFFFN